jgi:hypothetical protein
MTLSVNERVWVYAERLYIHVYSVEEFKRLLKAHGIKYDYHLYAGFKVIQILYTFMSKEDYTFSEFMRTVPSYKYLPLLEDIVFDPKVLKTRNDNWNYYGESIKNWLPSLVDLLALAGVNVNLDTRKLSYDDTEPSNEADFLQYPFGDPFLDHMRREINQAYLIGLYLSVMFLSRKILETSFIRLFEVVFPKISNGVYDAQNHELWFDKNKNSHRGFGYLIDNLKQNARAFHEDKDLVLELCTLVKPFKDETNSCVHYDYKTPNADYVQQWKIPYVIDLARKLFKKYCNP